MAKQLEKREREITKITQNPKSLFFCPCRMNQAPTSGFEEDVGTRTTHHIMYPESAIDLDNFTSLVLIPFKTLDLQWLISALTTGTITQ